MDDWLPALVRKAEGEPLERYVDRLCDLFCNDFLSNPPRIADYSVKLAIGDDIEGRKKCFWHLITEGNGLEADR